jgi:protein-tyrosine phosphatase
MAEAMLRTRLAGFPGLTVASAGTAAVVGAGMTPEAQAVLAGGGWSGGPAHVARQLTPGLVASADLVLALTREHRRAVVQLDPAAVGRTFTLREFGYVVTCLTEEMLSETARRLAVAAEPEAAAAETGAFASAVGLEETALRTATAAVATWKGAVPGADPEQFDVRDPYGQPLAAYAEAAVRMLPAVDSIWDYVTAFAAAARGRA